MPRPESGGWSGDLSEWWSSPWRGIVLGLAFVALSFSPVLRFLVFLGAMLYFALRSRQPEEQAPVVETLTGVYLEWVKQGRATHAEIQAVVARLPSSLRRTFWPLVQQARELVADLENLSRSAQQMDQYLAGPYGQMPVKEAERLRAEIAGTEDPVVRDELGKALQAIEDAIADQKEIETLRDRVKAEATHVNASLQSVLSEVMKQRYSDMETARHEYQSAAERLQSVKSHVDAVQQVITSRPYPGA